MGATIVISLNFTPTAPRGSSFGTPPCWPHCPARRGPPIPWKCCGAAAARWWQAVDPWVWSLAWQKHGWNMAETQWSAITWLPPSFWILATCTPKKTCKHTNPVNTHVDPLISYGAPVVVQVVFWPFRFRPSSLPSWDLWWRWPTSSPTFWEVADFGDFG